MSEPTFDEIGEWSKTKLEIIRKYAAAYSTILARQANLYHIYIDGFAGAGMHRDRKSKKEIPGSPLNVVSVQPPFREYHFVELESWKAAHLKSLFPGRKDVFVHEGDCNQVLPEVVLPKVQYKDYRRALCLLDPYGLHLDWQVIQAAGKLGTIDLLLNFPIMDINMNALLRNPGAVKPEQAARFQRYWGDESWRELAYAKTQGLFEQIEEKKENEDVVQAFRDRLKKVAGFEYVPDAISMCGTGGQVIYYLVFASPKKTAAKIMGDIFRQARKTGGR